MSTSDLSGLVFVGRRRIDPITLNLSAAESKQHPLSLSSPLAWKDRQWLVRSSSATNHPLSASRGVQLQRRSPQQQTTQVASVAQLKRQNTLR